MHIKDFENILHLFVLLSSLGLIFGQSESFTPTGTVAKGPEVTTPVGQIAGQASVNKTQEILFIPSPIDLWLTSQGIGAGPSGQKGPSLTCKIRWYFGCEPWHPTIPELWSASLRPYNKKYNYKDWRGHVKPRDIPRLTALLNNMRKGGI